MSRTRRILATVLITLVVLFGVGLGTVLLIFPRSDPPADLTIELSGWTNAQLESGLFEDNIGATIIIDGPTGSGMSTVSL